MQKAAERASERVSERAREEAGERVREKKKGASVVSAKERSVKERLKRTADAIFIPLAFSLLFGMLIVPNFREDIANVLNFVLEPLVAHTSFLFTILILAVLTGIYTSLIQKFTMNFELIERSRELQKRLREIQREYIAARKEGDKKRLKKVEREQKRLMSMQMQISSEMFRQQIKPMAYSMLITLPLFFWMWEYANIHSEKVIFPMIGECSLANSFFFLNFLKYWMVWYIICSIVITTIVRKLLGM
ncbi:MAG: EMC3/TMCO1 family protein [Candidatus Methanospirare jalkutatii]|nr:EMC3/TMCO1 family protein [Candidatus Methanospirare jalkutatii]